MGIIITTPEGSYEAPVESVPVEETESKEAEESGTSEVEVEQDAESEEPEQEEESESEEESDDEDESEGDEKGDDAETEERPRKKQSGYRRRINKLNSRIAERDQEIEFLRRKLESRTGEEVEPKTDPVMKSKPVTDNSKPSPDDFDDQDEYFEALTDWKVEQKLKAKEQEQEKAKVLTEQEQQVKRYYERAGEFAKKQAPDFQEVVGATQHIARGADFDALILSSDNGPELIYELSKDLDEYERVVTLPPLQMAKEIGRLEAKLLKQPQSKTEVKKVTKAPKPISPVNPRGTAEEPSIYNAKSQAEYEALRMKQIKAREKERGY